MRKAESLSTKTYIWSLLNIRKQKNVIFAQFPAVRCGQPEALQNRN